MKRSLSTVGLALCIAAPLAAQGNMGTMPMGRGGDPTTAVMGSGTLPPNWMMKIDASRGAAPPATAVSFEAMAGGYHVKSGPAAIYYNMNDAGSGQYSVTATFKQAKSMAHEAFGLFIAGQHLQDSAQTYVYFVIKPSDGTVLIAHRTSWAARTTAIVPENAAAPDSNIHRDSPTDGSASNMLLIHVAKDSVHFAINGKVIKAISKADLGLTSSDGTVGIRINHNIDMQIDGYTFKKY